MASNAENVRIWLRHHVLSILLQYTWRRARTRPGIQPILCILEGNCNETDHNRTSIGNIEEIRRYSCRCAYPKTSDISHTLVGSRIIDHSDVVEASPVGAAPTASSFSTEHLASIDCVKTTARRDKKHLNFGFWCGFYTRFNCNSISAALTHPV